MNSNIQCSRLLTHSKPKFNREERGFIANTMADIKYVLLKRQLFLKILLAIQILLCLISCSLIKSGVERPNPFELIITLNKSEYSPGEAVICTVYLYNKSDKEQTMQKLDAYSLSFWVAPLDFNEVVRIEPVYSKKEMLGKTSTLSANSGEQRQFVFTKLTENEGSYKFQSIYQPEPDFIQNPQPELVTKPNIYTVVGGRKFSRDEDGILTKASAIKLAEQKVGMNVINTDAKLIENELGFLEWWINLTMTTGEEGKEVTKSYLINPYLCSVRKETKPFKRKPEEKPPIVKIPKKPRGESPKK